jgi:hypothetical protein
MLDEKKQALKTLQGKLRAREGLSQGFTIKVAKFVIQ